MFYVYEIVNLVNGKKYIGKTKNPKTRWRKHLSVVERQNPNEMYIIHYAMIKYQVENFEFKILNKFETEQEAFDKEIELIALFKTNIKKYGSDFGYNLTDGGEGTTGHKKTDEEKKRMSERMKGNNPSKEIRAKMRFAKLGTKPSQETINKISKSLTYLKRTEKDREKISSLKIGEKNPASKLTEKYVKEIKIMLLNDKSPANICKIYKVARKTISDIKKNKTWQSVELTSEDINNTSNILAKIGNVPNQIKLNKEKAKEIKVLIALEQTDKNIAIKYGVNPAIINDIRSNKAWREDSGIGSVTNSKLNKEKVLNIKKLIAENKLSLTKIADMFEVEPGTINKIIKGKTWKDVI
jgi:group I intron endonuclease